jgi:site-specific DNA recombinase
MLHVLLSFAQFEREIISERTRDKMAAARRKGQWLGGTPVLGYDVQDRKLIVNEAEAECVGRIFALYLEHQGLIGVVQELDRRGWVNKCWTTRHGTQRGGKPFTKTSLHRLLTNVTYVGQVQYQSEIHAGQQAAIVDPDVWKRTQALLKRQGRSDAAPARIKLGALLQGILFCAACRCAMTPTHATKNGKTRYRYYVCSNAQKRGWSTCPSKSVPAHEIEQLVIDQIQGIAEAEWEPLTRLVERLVSRVEFDGASGKLSITLHPPGPDTEPA